jgi:hypothetical protein
MKTAKYFLLTFLLLNSIAVAAFAYGGYSGYSQPARKTYAYLGLNFEGGAHQSGGGLGMTSAHDGDIQLEFWMDYRGIATTEGTTGVFDMMLGGVFFPEDPAFTLGDIPVRVKISLLGGFGMGNDMFFATLMRTDLVFAGRWDSGGLTMGLGYRPGVNVGETHIPSEVTFDVGFLFSPVG